MRGSIFLISSFVVGFVSLVGCGPGNRMGNGGAGGNDDAGTAGGDLALRGSDGGGGSPDMAYPGKLFHYVTDNLRFPQAQGEYGFAPNHDGSSHNQLAKVALALFQNNLPLQPAEMEAINVDGDSLELLSVASLDGNLLTDPASFVNLYVASAARQPDLSGAGSFTPAPGGKAVLAGNLAGGTFYGADPANATAAPTAPLRIALLSTQRVTLPLVGAHITFTATPSGLMMGQLHGALRKADLDTLFIATLAQNLNVIATQPNCAQNADCTNVQNLFDTLPKDGKITAIEVKSSALLSSLLVPDVALFDAQGKWKPDPQNTTPDSFTIGIGFTAKKATFVEP